MGQNVDGLKPAWDKIVNSELAGRILLTIQDNPMGPSQIANKLNSSSSTISQLLSPLRTVNTVKKLEKEGRIRPYTTSENHLFHLWNTYHTINTNLESKTFFDLLLEEAENDVKESFKAKIPPYIHNVLERYRTDQGKMIEEETNLSTPDVYPVAISDLVYKFDNKFLPGVAYLCLNESPASWLEEFAKLYPKYSLGQKETIAVSVYRDMELSE